MSERSVKPYIGLLTGIVAVSWASILIRLAEAPPLVVGAYRLTIASIILTPMALARAREELRGLARRDICLALLSGAFLSLHFASWIASLDYTSVATSVVLVSTQPLFAGIASHLLTADKVSRSMFAGIIVSIIGGIIIGYGDISIDRRAFLGDLLATIGAIAASAYFLIGRQLRRKLSLLAYIFLVYWMAALGLVALCLLTRQRLTGYPPQTYLMFLLLAIVPQIIGHSSFNWALRYLSATFVTISTLGEPFGATILAYFILKETPSPAEIMGGALILWGIYIASREERIKR